MMRLRHVTQARPGMGSHGAHGNQINYRALFSHHVEGDLLEEIRSSVNKGMAIGHDRFKVEIEVLTGRRPKPKKRIDLSDGVRKRVVFNVYLTLVIRRCFYLLDWGVQFLVTISIIVS